MKDLLKLIAAMFLIGTATLATITGAAYLFVTITETHEYIMKDSARKDSIIFDLQTKIDSLK